MRLKLDLHSLADYKLFLAIKSLPRFRFAGRIAEFPDEYAATLGLKPVLAAQNLYTPLASLFDYQRDISRLAIRKQKFAVFAECGLGKSLVLLEFARHALSTLSSCRKVLIVSPINVIAQTMAECHRFYGDTLFLERVRAAQLPAWTETGGSCIGITNYEAITDQVKQGNLGALILDESSLLKSHYGKWGQRLIALGKGLDWKLCLTGTPAPNDRIEYANHAVFLDQFPTVNSFLARYFVNRGQTNERWELKPHALRPFYLGLSHWSLFLTNPATYGWKDNTDNIPPIHVHLHDVPLTEPQHDELRRMGIFLGISAGGITSRGKLSQLAKGRLNGHVIASNKPGFIRDLVQSWPDESTLIWCIYNPEQEELARLFPGSANLSGVTPEEERQRLIADFQARRRSVAISKSAILGYGLNLQVCTRQVFSGLVDSYEKYHQCIKRANRIGSSRPLHVHIPATEIEMPMVETVFAKLRRIQQDTEEQERLFKEFGHVTF